MDQLSNDQYFKTKENRHPINTENREQTKHINKENKLRTNKETQGIRKELIKKARKRT